MASGDTFQSNAFQVNAFQQSISHSGTSNSLRFAYSNVTGKVFIINQRRPPSLQVRNR